MRAPHFFRWLKLASAYAPLVSAWVLIFASVLKINALLSIEQPSRSFWYSRFFLSFVAAMELLLGMAMLLYCYPGLTVNAARVVFFVFFQFVLYLALAGQKMCPCLGVLALPPWFMAAFDGLMFAALMACDYRVMPERTIRTHPRTFAVCLLLYLLIAIPALLAANRHTPEEIKGYARQDTRLLAKLSITYKHVDQQDLVERIGKETGITLKVGSRLQQRQKNFSHLHFHTVPAWVLMEYIARSHGDLHWSRAGTEYHLVRLPWWQRLAWWLRVIPRRLCFALLLLAANCCIYFYLRGKMKSRGAVS